MKIKLISFLTLASLFLSLNAFAYDPKASQIKTKTTNFNGILSATQDDVQKSLDIIDDAIPSGGSAPIAATYITQTTNSSLSGEQALASLATGIVKNTTSTGVLSIAAQGTDYYAPSGTDVAVADGGTGASDASGARTALGLAIGTNVQAWDADLDVWATMTPSPTVKNVGCSDSIQTAVTNATAGDTLILGSCTYTITSAIAVNKELTIKGQGSRKTKITSSTDGIQLITTTSDALQLIGMSLEGTSVQTGVLINLTATTSTSGVNNLFKDVVVEFTSDPDNGTQGIMLEDTGANIEDVYINLTKANPVGSSDQIRAISFVTHDTANVNAIVRAKDVFINVTNSGEGANTQTRGFFCYNYQDLSPVTMTSYIQNMVSVVRNGDIGGTSALMLEGTNTIANVYGGYFDGDTGATNALHADIKSNINPVINLYGSVAINGNLSEANSGVINEYGYFNGGGVTLVGLPQPDPSTSAASAATNVVTIDAPNGGNTTGTGSRSGGIGSGFLSVLGDGGVANSANTASTGGKGGSYTLTSGAGGNATTASGTNTGGVGGDFTVVSGAGGSASTGSSNSGGVGGAVSISAGVGGNGTGGGTGVKGGNSTFAAGAGGVGTTTGGGGGDVFINAGAGGDAATDGVGGNIYFYLAPSKNLAQKFVMMPITSGTVAQYGFGINTASTPLGNLEIQDNFGTTWPIQVFNRNDASINATNPIGEIDFYGQDTELTTQKNFAKIEVFSTSTVTTDAAAGYMSFYTTGTTAGSSPVERMRIDEKGSVRVIPQTAQTISAGNTITDDACGSIKLITSAGAVTTDTTNTFTAPASTNQGCIMRIINVGSNNITLDNNANFKSAGGADVVMTADDAVIVASSGASGKWYQLSALEAN